MHCKKRGLVVHFPWHVVSQTLFYFFSHCQIL